MTVIVLKRGQIPEDLIYEGECLQCESELRADWSDHLSSVRAGKETTLFVKCPVCQNNTWLDSTDKCIREVPSSANTGDKFVVDAGIYGDHPENVELIAGPMECENTHIAKVQSSDKRVKTVFLSSLRKKT